MPEFCPVTSVEIDDGRPAAEETINITPPPAGAVAGALMYPVPELGPDIYLAASITTPPPA